MSVGLVIVSHSSKLAEGVAELAGQMAQGKVRLAAAGGAEGDILGTSTDKILAAILALDSPDGILVLLDLGSAILSAEMALEFLDEEQHARTLLSYAPLVEGAFAAALEASLGSPLSQVKRAAENMSDAEQLRKFKPISKAEEEGQTAEDSSQSDQTVSKPIEVQVTINNAAGLHARPASQFVQTAARFQASIQVRAHGKQANAKSIINVLSLAVRQNDTITLQADGSDAQAAIDALSQLIKDNFGAH